ncbi:MAG: Purine nucleoside phosphoramidase [Syntrophomonadaceae bacterium]|nr:Purine nucleoside phosphoramidase [Bacillota bacterium]
MSECIFCKIAARELPAEIVFEDEKTIAFKDINPHAPVHVLLVPKQHYTLLDDLPENEEEAGRLLLNVKKVAAILGISGGYKVLVNNGQSAGQVVPHLHVHLLAGKKFAL